MGGWVEKETYRHHAVGGIKGLLHPVAVVDVDVDVKDTVVVLEELQNSQHAIVHIAKTRGFALFRVGGWVGGWFEMIGEEQAV